MDKEEENDHKTIIGWTGVGTDRLNENFLKGGRVGGVTVVEWKFLQFEYAILWKLWSRKNVSRVMFSLT